MDKVRKGNMMSALREEVIEGITNQASISGIASVASEAGVSVATVYNFLARKNFNKKLIDWYFK